MYNPQSEKKFLQNFAKQFPPREPVAPLYTHKVTGSAWRWGEKEVAYETPVGTFKFKIDFSSEIVRALYNDLYHLTVESDPVYHTALGHTPPALLLWNNCYQIAHDPVEFTPSPTFVPALNA